MKLLINSEYLSFDVDPTKRESFYSVSIGMFFHVIGFSSINQGYIQKYLSLRSINHIKWAITLFVIGTSIFVVISVFTGLLLYTKYSQCDPFTNGDILKKDQILPYYVLDVAKTVPGLAGLFLSGLLSAGLSTLSTCLNCLSGTIYEDFISPFMPKTTTEKTVGNILKLIVLIIGIISSLLIFLIERMGNVLSVYFVLNGITSGPLLGIFTLGMLFSSANSKGAMIGTGASLLIMSYIVIQSHIYQSQGYIKYDTKPISTDGCDSIVNNTIIKETMETAQTDFEPLYIFRISHYYYTVLGMLIMILIALPASFIFKDKNARVSKYLISPLVYWTMKKKEINIDYNSEEISNTLCVEEHRLNR